MADGKIQQREKLRNTGVVDTTPRRLPASVKPIFDELCTDPSLTCREIRRRMVHEGFRMTLSAIEKYASRLRRKLRIQRSPGRRSPGTFAKLAHRSDLHDSGRIEAIAQAQALALSVSLGSATARDVVARMAKIVSVSGGVR